MKVLTTLLILTIGSLAGCVSSTTVVPYCPPDRPDLEPINVVVQQEIIQIPNGREAIASIASNDLKLKSHIKTLEQLGAAVNEANGVGCDEEG